MFTVNSGGAIASSYFNVLAGDKVVGRQPILPSGSRRFYHTDLLGSTRSVTNGVTGAVLESYDFDPWGLLMPGRTLAGPTKEGFTSKEQDAETGLDYFGARYYMPALARWTAVDPLAENHPEWSPYNYVLNNPPALIDPDGRQVPAAFAYYQYRLARFRARQDEQAQRSTSGDQNLAGTQQEAQPSSQNPGGLEPPDPAATGSPAGVAAAALTALAGCPPNCTVTAWDNLFHVINDHLLRGTPSQFRDMSHDALKKVVDVTVRRFDGVLRQANGNLVFERVWKGGIGTRGEQIVRVITTATGELVTAFPVKNPMVLRVTGAVAGAGFSRLGKFARSAAGGALMGAGVWLITSPTPIACQQVYGC